MVSLVLTLIGDDRPGLVSAVSGPVEACGGSWQRSQLARLAGKFAGVVLVDVPAESVAALEASLARLGESGLQVAVTRDEETPARATQREVSLCGLHLLGQDRPGILAEVSAALAAHGVGIDRLTTDVRDAPMAGGMLFEVDAELSVPAGVDVAAVRADLERLADELMVDLGLTED